MIALLEAIISLLDDPNNSSPLNSEAAHLWNDKDAFRKRAREVYNNLELTIKYAEALAVTSWFKPSKYNEVRTRVLVALEAEDEWIDEFTDEINERLSQIEAKDMESLEIDLDEFEED